MTWVTIKGHRYYRQSRRVNGRVVTEHLGGGKLGEAMAVIDAAERTDRRIDASFRQAGRILFSLHVAQVFGIERFLADLFAVLAHECGYHRHHRQWRKSRGADPMIAERLHLQIDKLKAALEKAERGRAPLLAPDFTGLPDEDRLALQAAAKGDKAALAKVQSYLTDPNYVRVWGDPMYAARCWLVYQVAGDDLVVARTTHARAKALRQDLGYETANTLERVAITRVVHGWLAVAALEAKACQLPVGSRERANAEKAVTQADRRLTQAVKTLAFLRECTVAALMARLGQANAEG